MVPYDPAPPANIADLLRQRAAETPDRIAFRFLGDGETVTEELTFLDLDRRARNLARVLAQAGAPDDVAPRALLLYPSGSDYVVAFVACLYAGVIAVPVYPPESGAPHHTRRLMAILADAAPSMMLTLAAQVAPLQALLEGEAGEVGAGAVRILASDALPPHADTPWTAPPLRGADVAFLQYTSGSTAQPKGVRVTHGNLMANQRAIQLAFGIGAGDTIVSWLPLYHDMGLIGGLLQPLFSGVPLVLLSPRHFLERPVRWLQAIARFGGTVSGGPDFAYRLCAERVTAQQLEQLDLRCWKVAFSGSEPVRAETMRAFASRFGAAGFDRQALYPCYGLAEATLLVSGGRRGAGHEVLHADAAELAQDRFASAADGLEIVGAGAVQSAHALCLVVPATQRDAAEGEIGEIWFHGPSVADGYWNAPAASAAAFVERGGRRWLRTGDLGFLHEQRLFVTGRLKDMIIVRGQNLYPQDIEQSIEHVVHAVRKGRVAAFPVQLDGREGIGVAAEIGHAEHKRVTPQVLAQAIAEAVARGHGEAASVVLLLKPGALPRTTSGKLQRSACAARWADGSLELWAAVEASDLRVAPDILRDGERNAATTLQRVAAVWQEVLETAQVGGGDNFFALGGNSLASVRIAAQLQESLGIEIDLAWLFDTPDLAAFCERIDAALVQGGGVTVPPLQRRMASQLAPELAYEMAPAPASFAQQRMWFLWSMEPHGAAYNIAGSLQLRGALDAAAVAQALQALVVRHAGLRSVFDDADGHCVQKVLAPSAAGLAAFSLERDYTDLGTLAPHARAEALRALVAATASAPFDLAAGPLWRARLIRLANQEHVLAVALHHIVADGASMRILIGDFMALYQAAHTGRPATLAALPVDYADYAEWQRALLADGQERRQLDYWTGQLGADGDSVLALPLDRPRPAQQRGVGASHAFALAAPLTQRLRAFARGQGATPFMVLCAAFNVLLHRYSGQAQVRVGVPFANRRHAGTRDLVGLLVNTLVLRSDWQPHQDFRQVLAQVRATTLAAQAHADLPFERLVEALQPARSLAHHPLFQVMLNHQEAILGPRQQWPGLEVSAAVADAGISKFDLCLNTVAQGIPGADDDVIGATLVYSTDLFDAATMARMAHHFVTLLERLLDKPGAAVGMLDYLDEAERRQLLAWSRGASQSDVFVPVQMQIASAARAAPHAVALLAGASSMTYGELDRRSDLLATQLARLGAGPDVVVGVMLERSFELVLSLLAVLKSGAAYLPLDPAAPAARNAFMARDAGSTLLLRAGAAADRADDVDDTGGAVWPAGMTTLQLDGIDWDLDQGMAAPRAAPPAAANLAYVLYTSGTTGRPKGVANTHGALASRLAWMQREYHLTSDDTLLQKTPTSFDVSVWEIFWSLSSGARLVLPAPGEHRDPAALAQLIERHAVTTVHFVPSMLQLFVAPDDAAQLAHRCRSLRRLFSGGEALTRELQERVLSVLPGVRFDNRYGPTEALINATAWTCRPEPHVAVPIGRPLPDTDVYLLDAQGGLVPPGVAGELLIGGAGLARGYAGQAALTAQRFVPDPFSAKPGARLYRSGDRARWRADGVIEYLGRADQQVKIRGYRIEPGEVEALLRDSDEVREAAVVALAGPGGSMRLVAYLGLAAQTEGASPDHNQIGQTTQAAQAAQAAQIAQIKRRLATQLPDYMVPSLFVPVARLPLMASGKLDRAALPAPVWETRTHAAPETPVERAVAQVWQDMLQLEHVGLDDGFLDLGGHSLLATQVVSRLRKAYDIELPLRTLFESADLRSFAQQVQASIDSGRRDRQPALLPADRSAPLRLSYSQERMWFLWKMEPHGAAYNVGGAVQLDGPLDIAALRAALNAMLMRHEGLRTTFPSVDGLPVQRIAADAGIELEQLDLSMLAPPARAERTAQLLESEAHRPYDLERGPLMRMRLLILAPHSHLLLVGFHHIVAEGWAMDVFADEFSALYRDYAAGRAPALAPLAVQYADFAVWQRRWLEGGEGERQLAYWRQRLGRSDTVLDLPFDRPRPAVQEHAGDFLTLTLPAPLARDVAAFNRAHGVTLFMTVAAATMALLFRYSGQGDLRLGYPIANRTRPEFERIIGGFLNTQVLQCDVDAGMSAGALLAAVREAALQAQAHQDVPFHAIVDAVRPERSAAHAPLFQVMCNVQRWRFQQTREVAPGLRQTFLPNDARSAKFDLMLDVTDIDDSLACMFTYKTGLFDRATVAAMAQQWVALLQAMVRAPAQLLGRLPLEAPAALAAAARQANGARQRFAVTVSLAQWFERQAALRGDAVALCAPDGVLSYAQLNARANRVARRLRALGVCAETLVGLAVERSLDTVVGVLAVLKAGGAYLPLDPAYPAERLAFMLADAKPLVVLTHAHLCAGLPQAPDTLQWCFDRDAGELDGLDESDLGLTVHPDQLAYCIYTSGSTGRPKGALMTHANAVRLFLASEAQFGFGVDDVWTMFHSHAFDFSVWEVFGALLYGGRLVIVPYLTSRSPADFLALLRQHQVTVLNQTPSAFRQLMLAPDLFDAPASLALRYVIFGGEALDPATLQPWFAHFGERRPQLVNMYGITETTVHVTWRTLTAADAGRPGSPIGAPLADLHWYVLDTEGEPQPVGVRGELYVGGPGLARAYLGRPGLTAQRFVPDPFSGEPGARLYRTGDVACRRRDGEMDYQGRADAQVKIRGFRIEPGEIEGRLRALPQVVDAVVVARKGDDGQSQLVAYLVGAAVTAGGAESLRDEARRQLEAALPGHMVPAAFVVLTALPLTANGKLDQARLPAPTFQSAASHVPPQDRLQERLVAVWRQVLRQERIGIQDNFFEIGGDSISAVRMVGRLREEGIVATPQMLFQHQTIALLSARLHSESAVHAVAPLAAPAAAPPAAVAFAGTSYALTPMQEGILFHSQAERHRGTYLVQCSCALDGALDEAAFQAAWEHVLASHDILRTGFTLDDDGRSWQTVQDAVVLPLHRLDWQGRSVAQQEQDIVALLDDDHAVDFDLERAPLMRLTLVLLGPQRRHLVWTHHHLLMDAWSVDWLLAEVARNYHALAAGQALAARTVTPFRDYVAWVRAQDAAAAKRYWREALAGLADPLLIGRALRPLGPRPAGAGMGRLERSVAAPATQALLRHARAQRITLNTLVQGALLLALSSVSRRGQPVLGVTVSGRHAPLPGIFDMKGLFINTVPLFADITHGTEAGAWLRRLQDDNLKLREHAYLPLVDIQSCAAVARGTPLFDVIFVFENHPLDEAFREDIRRLGVSAIRSQHRNGYPLTVIVWPEDELKFLLLYEPGHLDEAQAALLFQRIEALLSTWADGSQVLLGGGLLRVDLPAPPAAPLVPLVPLVPPVPLVSPVSPSVPVSSSAPVVAPIAPAVTSAAPANIPMRVASMPLAGTFAAATLHGRVAWHAARTPNAVALVCGDISLSYHQLNRSANRLARSLRARGVGAEVLVGLAGQRSPALLVAMLAILKAGGAYLPIDPHHPAQRIADMVADARPLAILAERELLPLLPAATPIWCLEDELGAGPMATFGVGRDAPDPHDAQRAQPDDDIDLDDVVGASHLAYCIYTSGSTGKPKGALLTHANATRLFDTCAAQFGFGVDDVWTMFHSHAFDFSVWEIFGALTHGAKLILVPYLTSRAPQEFLQLLIRERVSVLNQTPSAFRQLLELPELYARSGELALRQVIFGGEALDPRMLQPWFAHVGDAVPQLVNMYGITETTVHVSYRRLSCADAHGPASLADSGASSEARATMSAGVGAAAGASPCPIGWALADLDWQVLDADLNQVPPGAEGELYVGGPGLARGYLRRGGLSADRFIPHPYSHIAGARLYRTGDLVRMDGAGGLDYLGRIDQQVKLRGFRIELGEIEASLRALPGLRDAVVSLRGEGAGQHLLAHVVLADDAAAPARTDAAAYCRAALQSILPDYMTPAAYVVMTHLPLTVNGKRDLAALPPPDGAAQMGQGVHLAPNGALETALAQIWMDVLALERVSADASFLELGGHSLSAVKVAAQVKKQLGVAIPLAVLFELTTVRRLAAWIDVATRESRQDVLAMQQLLEDLDDDGALLK